MNQLVINQAKNYGQDYMQEVMDVIDGFGRSSKEVTAQEVADGIVEKLKSLGADVYIVTVDVDSIKEFYRRPSDELEIRYFDYDGIDDEVALVRIGRPKGKGNIYIHDAPQPNNLAPYSLVVHQGQAITQIKRGKK